MIWNYRIGVEKTKNPWAGDEWDGDETHSTTYYVIKCFYDKEGEEPYSFTKVSLLQGTDERSLKIEVRNVVEAFSNPTIDINSFEHRQTDQLHEGNST